VPRSAGCRGSREAAPDRYRVRSGDSSLDQDASRATAPRSSRSAAQSRAPQRGHTPAFSEPLAPRSAFSPGPQRAGDGSDELEVVGLRGVRRSRAAIAAAATAWMAIGLIRPPLPDLLGFVVWAVFMRFMLRGRYPLLYAVSFVMTMPLEFYGTALGVWRWSLVLPVLGFQRRTRPAASARGIARWMRSPVASSAGSSAVEPRASCGRRRRRPDRGMASPGVSWSAAPALPRVDLAPTAATDPVAGAAAAPSVPSAPAA